MVTTSLRSPAAIWSIKVDHTQRAHRVDIEDVGPGIVVDISDTLSGRAGDPGTVGDRVDGDVVELRCGVSDGFGVGHVHWNDGKHAGASP
jgi:hypothetical protein